MFRLFCLAGLSASLVACLRWMAIDPLAAGQPPADQATASDLVKSVNLLAREESLLPPGAKPTLTRPIGFAAVFLQIENPQAADVTVMIQKVQILNAAGQVQLETAAAQALRLRPLENATTDIHLTNQAGYVGGDRVKAIVTYRVNGQTQVIESAPVAVERH